uniref:Polygalacturonase n=1 Tax=Kalanchoe fedtschenkoi TaxID=63787 RepID=A0A7N0TIJ2_KALFE
MMRNPNAFLFLSECILVIISLPVLTSPLTPSNLSAAPDFPSASKRPFVLDIHQFGAKGDGLSDDTQVLGEVWKLACSSARQSTILLPAGNKYLVGPVDFAGPCRNKVTILICGTLVAPDNPDIWKGFNRRRWLYFYGIKHLTVEGGGIINGMGAQWWAQSCKRNSTKRCRPAPTAITFHKCNNLKISNLQMVNSQQMHMAFTSCFHVKATHLNVVAPDTSPNTDGIHISSSSGIEIRKSLIKTGDDCISMVGNSSRIRIRDVICGPGHGISVGSLGKSNSSDQIHDVLVEAIFLLHTQNGLRIKTWQVILFIRQG